jgi:FMN hydrolase / 5-amino-6-(5-phospho-D-ribitylamino)uracil phosphatase
MRQPIALGFDLDNTLWDVGPVMERAERALHEWLASHYPRVTASHSIDAMREKRVAVAARRPDLAHDFTALRRLALHEHAEEAGYPIAMVDQAFEEFYRERNQVELYDDVLPALDRLRSRYRLLALTNGNADLGRIGIAHYFELIVTARAVGYAKPDGRIFAALLAGAAVTASDLLYVGDEPIADVEGPRGSDIEAVWINRGGRKWPAGLAPPRHTVTTLHELADWLDGEV